MNTFRKYHAFFIGIALVGLFAMNACKKVNETSGLKPMEMFMPGDFSVISHSTDVLISWKPSLYTNSTDTSITYTFQVFEDSTFQSDPILSAEVDTTGIRFTDDQLKRRKEYFGRVKANQKGDRPESRWASTSGFKITGVQLLYTGKTRTQANSVELHWDTKQQVSKILILDSMHIADSTVATVSGTEASDGVKIVEGLNPDTKYHVELYANNKDVGYTDFRTKKAVSGTIIDLSSITNNPSILDDTLPKVPSGSVIFLKRGENYSFGGYGNLDKSVVIMSKPGYAQRAHIQITGGSGFNIKSDSQIDTLKLRDLVLSGDYASNYVLNVSNGGDVSAVIFDNCSIHTFRGIFRIKASDPTNFTSINYVNCVIDSINGYGIMNVDNANASVKSIRVRNTTITNANVMFAGRSGLDSLLLENCTLYNSPAVSGRYVATFGSNAISYVGIQSCIFGKTNGTKGIDAGDGTHIFVSSSYKTNDYDSRGHNINDLTLYNQASADIFNDPENGDLTIIDASFPRIGDPRWLQ